MRVRGCYRTDDKDFSRHIVTKLYEYIFISFNNFMKFVTLFSHILANSTIGGFTNMLLWFAITFWAYLETRSVFVTGVLGGVYLVLNLLGGLIVTLIAFTTWSYRALSKSYREG